MKIHGRLLPLLALAATTLSAAPFVALGDSAELFLTATISVSADDNIFLKNGETHLGANNATQDDVILDFAPGLDLVFGRKTATQGNVFFKENIMRYSDNDDQNTNLVSVGFNSRHEDGKTKVDIGASYVETAQNDSSAPGHIIPKSTTNFRALSEFAFSEKTSAGVGVRWEKSDYDTSAASYRDNKILTVPLDVYFATSPKLQTSVGYRYRATSLTRQTLNAVDSKDHFFNVGARGEFTPKLTGQLRVGFGKRNYDNGLDDTSFGVDSGFTYAFSPKTTYQFSISNDFGTSALGETTKTTSVSMNAINKIDDQWSWNANLVYRNIDFPGHSDDFIAGGLGVSYIFSNSLNFAAGYNYKKNGSNSLLYEFKNNIFNLSANIRY